MSGAFQQIQQAMGTPKKGGEAGEGRRRLSGEIRRGDEGVGLRRRCAEAQRAGRPSRTTRPPPQGNDCSEAFRRAGVQPNRGGGVVLPGQISRRLPCACAVRFVIRRFDRAQHLGGLPPRRGCPQNAGPKAETGQSAAPAQPPATKSEIIGSNDQSGPSNAKPTANQDGQGDKATIRPPAAPAPKSRLHAPRRDTARWSTARERAGRPPTARPCRRNSPSATTPSIVPIMAWRRWPSATSRSAIIGARRLGPALDVRRGTAEELPIGITVQDWPAAASDPAFAKMKYVRAQDRILLVEPTNRVVIGEIPN